MQKVVFMFMFFSLVVAVGCRRHDWRALVIEVPEMHNEAATQMVVQALSRGPGIKPGSIQVNPVTRQVFITYDSLLAADMNFVFLVAGAGFAANEIPGDAAARAAWPPDVQP